MTRKKAQKTTKKITHVKWTTHKMDLHVKEYCHNAAKDYLDEEHYKKAVRRLTTRTGWTKRELEGWLALSSFKTCATNKVMGSKSARQETAVMSIDGGPKGERAKAVRGMRELIVKRVGGADKPVVSYAMLREWKDNKRELCGGRKVGVTAAVLMAAAQEGAKVEMFELGCGGKRGRDGVAEAQQWAVEAGWIGEAEAGVTLAAWRKVALEREATNQYIMIEMGEGWNGATEGFKKVFDRVVGIDRKRQKIAKGNKSQPDFLKEFEEADQWEGGMVLGMAARAGVRAKDRICSFASIDCTEETLAQAFNKWKKHGKGYYAGKKRTKWAQDGLNAVIRGINIATTEDPHHQFCLENPAWSALRFDKDMLKYFGEGIVVKPCAYGDRMSGKEYRFWMTPDALHEFRDIEVKADDAARSRCKECIAGEPHKQAACPQKGDERPRVSAPGLLQKAARNRIPPLLASVIGRALIKGRTRSELREQLETKRVR
jgi:hypothetical protein